MTRSRVLIRWSLVLIWASFMWFLSNQPDLNSGLPQDFLLRKIAHVLEYSILTGFLWHALKLHFAKPAALFTAAVAAVLYAATDEWHQSFVHGRHGTWHDVLIDSIGIIGVLLLSFKISHKKTARL